MIEEIKHDYHYFFTTYNSNTGKIECVNISEEEIKTIESDSVIRYCFITKETEMFIIYSSGRKKMIIRKLRSDILKYIKKIDDEYTIKKRNENINEILQTKKKTQS